jgi:hypothetical protein
MLSICKTHIVSLRGQRCSGVCNWVTDFKDTFSTSKLSLGSDEWYEWAYNSTVIDEWGRKFCETLD